MPKNLQIARYWQGFVKIGTPVAIGLQLEMIFLINRGDKIAISKFFQPVGGEMHFVLFTSLSSLILILIAVRLYFWFKRKFRDQLSTTGEIIKNGIGDFLTEFNKESILYYAENMKEKFCSQLTSCVDAQEKAGIMLSNLDERIEIERKSLEYISKEYKKIKTYFKNTKNKILKDGDFDTYNKILEFEAEIDDKYKEMSNIRPFIHCKVLANHIESKEKALPEGRE